MDGWSWFACWIGIESNECGVWWAMERVVGGFCRYALVLCLYLDLMQD